MNTEIQFCCEGMKMSILRGEFIIGMDDEVVCITTNDSDRAIGVTIQYCPHCGKKVSVKTGGK